VAIGGGYADYEQSTTVINGQPNRASRELARGVFDFGAGFDPRVWRWAALRASRLLFGLSRLQRGVALGRAAQRVRRRGRRAPVAPTWFLLSWTERRIGFQTRAVFVKKHFRAVTFRAT
jgi:hypothetical protein